MFEFGAAKCSVYITLACDNPDFSDYSRIHFLRIIFVDLYSSRLICIQGHFFVLWITRGIEANIFVGHEHIQRFDFIREQGISKFVEGFEKLSFVSQFAPQLSLTFELIGGPRSGPFAGANSEALFANQLRRHSPKGTTPGKL